MANLFALILLIATLLTGILWCVQKISHARQKKALAQPASTEKPRAGWFDTLASLFPVLALVLIVRSFIYEPFQIPSGSMMPTLLVGDFILVEKFAYGLKDPVTQTTLIHTGEPKRGDIAVFKYPGDPTLDYIKRVIGLPGDRVIYDPFSKEISVYPHCASDESCNPLPIRYSDIQPADYVFSHGRTPDDSGLFFVPQNETRPDSERLQARDETLDGVNHKILQYPGNSLQQSLNYYQQPGQPFNSWLVPDGEYFMMGDNRDNSEDSRYWGFVPEKNLVGKATIIWMSFKKREGEWPTGVRLKRIGSVH